MTVSEVSKVVDIVNDRIFFAPECEKLLHRLRMGLRQQFGIEELRPNQKVSIEVELATRLIAKWLVDDKRAKPEELTF